MRLRFAAGLLAVVGLLIYVLAACSSTTTGTETITGTTTNITAQTPTIPLSASGVFKDTGSITLTNNNAKCATDGLKFSKGTLRVYHCSTGNPNGTGSYSTTTCKFTQLNTGTFQAVSGSTGDLKGYTGKGTFKVTFTGVFAKKNGACPSEAVVNSNNSPNPTSGSITFSATGTLTS